MQGALLVGVLAWVALMVVLAGVSLWLRRRRRGRRKEDKVSS